MQVPTDRLRQRYDFDGWSTPQGESTLGFGFRLTGTELPGWRPHRIQNVDLPGDPPACLSVWRPARGNGALLAVNVYECDDTSAARAYLLRLLGEFQGPGLTRRTGPGDVAFAAGDAAVLFARDNFVALVRSIERTPAPVGENADRLDDVLAGQAAAPGSGPPAIDVLSMADDDVVPGRTTLIDVVASDSDDAPVWFRLQCGSGRLHLLNRRPAFTPESEGPHEITVHAIGASGIAERTLHIGRPPSD